MKIIETKSAPNPRRVRMFLAEKGIAVAYEEIDIMKGQHREAAFTKANPMQRVPVLVLDDGTAISETVAICRYFEETKPEPALFGTGALERATIEMWNRRMELGLLMHVAAAFRHTHPGGAALEVPQFKEFGEANKPRALEVMKVMDQQLAATKFIAGDTFSIADITGVIAVDFARVIKLRIPEELKHLARWHAEISARPSAKA
jgi:glutathione S-transferase